MEPDFHQGHTKEQLARPDHVLFAGDVSPVSRGYFLVVVETVGRESSVHSFVWLSTPIKESWQHTFPF